jgi:NACHT domain
VLDDVERWEVGDVQKSVYWLKGVAGCGKSVIAQTVAERSAANGRLGASFYCSRDFDDRSDLRLIFPTLAHELAHQHPTYRAALIPIIRSSSDVRHDSLDVQFEKLIIRPLKSLPSRLSFTIVIDALDECKDKEPVSQFLSALARHVNEIPNVKIFITGRPEDHIRSGFAIPSLKTRELPLHDLDSAIVDADIESYVKFRLEDIAIRRGRSISGPWPLDKDITAITRKCSGFFIIASVIVDFIDDPYETPQDQLVLVLSMSDSAIYAGKSVIDVRYGQILAASFRDVPANDSKPYDRFRLVLGSIVLAFNPLTRASLAKILGISSERIWTILYRLHSVLIVPDSDVEPIRICHKSFADFLIDQRRCSDARLHVNASSHHFEFAVRCFKLMNTKLTTNICRLPQYAMNNDITDLPARRDKYIGASLVYTCEFWSNHLQSSNEAGGGTGAKIVEPINSFLERHLLSWLEVLSIEVKLRVAVYSLNGLRSWLTNVGAYIFKS